MQSARRRRLVVQREPSTSSTAQLNAYDWVHAHATQCTLGIAASICGVSSAPDLQSSPSNIFLCMADLHQKYYNNSFRIFLGFYQNIKSVNNNQVTSSRLKDLKCRLMQSAGTLLNDRFEQALQLCDSLMYMPHSAFSVNYTTNSWYAKPTDL